MKKIVECVPNFSEGRDADKVEKIADAFRGREGVKLLDYQRDTNHNRSVITVIGEPGPLKEAVITAVGTAIALIDMRVHRGQHPRMGAVDVIPFIPLKNMNMEETVALSRDVAQAIYETHGLPVFLYEESATNPDRKNLAAIRKGQFEGMPEKLTLPEWKPDFGEPTIHLTAGVVAVGARMPLVAFNINIGTDNVEIAHAIARRVRHIGGGLRYCKAIGIALKERGITQVSMNMTDYTRTPLYQAFELVKAEAKRYGVNVIGSEIIGLVPLEAIADTAAYYMGIEDFTTEKILEARIME